MKDNPNPLEFEFLILCHEIHPEFFGILGFLYIFTALEAQKILSLKGGFLFLINAFEVTKKLRTRPTWASNTIVLFRVCFSRANALSRKL